MTSKRPDPQDWHEKRIQELRQQREAQTGKPESPASRETFQQRERKPGEAGLANEARPGLGTRGDDPEPAEKSKRTKRARKEDTGKPRATPYAYDEPRPAPRDQPSDSLAHEQERSTSASGQMGL